MKIRGAIFTLATMLLIQLIAPILVLRAKAQEFGPLNYLGNFSLSFDGTDDYVSCGQSQVFKQQKLTIEVWIKPKYTIQLGSNSLYGHIWGDVVAYYAAGGWWLQFDYANGPLYFRWTSSAGGRNYATNKPVWYNSSWYHLAVTFDPTLPNGNLKFYINGTLDSQHDDSNAIVYPTAYFKIGNYGGGAYGGFIDEVRLWNVSRAGSEIQDTMLRVLNNTEIANPNLIGYWRFDNGSGTTSHDYSVQGNDAALASNPATPQWASFGAPVVPEFQSFSVQLLVLTAVSIIILVTRQGIKNKRRMVSKDTPQTSE